MSTTFMPEDWTYKPDASLTLQGVKVPVSAFTLDLTANGVPTILITIDAFHIAGDQPEPALAPGVGHFVTRWRGLQDNIRSKTNRVISFTFDAHGTQDTLQKFELKDWIMTSAGFTGIRSHGGFALVIEAVHPMYAFQESTAHLLGSGQEGTIAFNEVAGDNVLEALLSAMRAYKSRYEDTADSAGAVKSVGEDEDYMGTGGILEEYQKMIDVLATNLEWDPTWDGEKFPDAAFGTNLMFMVPYGVVEYVKALNNAGSWDWLVRTFCAQWFLIIIPTFWQDTLKLRPCEPWQKYSMKIYDTDLVGLELPSVDPTPIKGVMGLINSLSLTGSLEWGNTPEGEDASHKELIAHTEPDLLGRFLTLGIPGWAYDLLTNKQAEDSGYTTPDEENLVKDPSWGMSNNIDDYAGKGSSSTVNREYWDDLQVALKAVAKELFLENYRMHYQISMEGRLMIRTEGSTLPEQFILPGYVMRIEANPDLPGNLGLPLLDFFVNKVVHSVDCQNGEVSTQISGGFIHDSGWPTLKAIKDGVARNSLYYKGAE